MITTPRHQSRELALQALYFWEVGRSAPDEALDHVVAAHMPDASDPVKAFAQLLVQGTVRTHEELDQIIGRHIDNWRIERLAVIDKLILRMATWELRYAVETPPAVVVNEALELARTYSADESIKFVNGVLDGIRKTLAMGQ
ncbi:MAG: transcription antitermination factor NusB [Acidobacteria bacterium]|nr:transcription antitermination factor NusB [Acidobacteriota bacterium]